jgi:XTP/dITP diphosphohydrolase
VEKVVYLITRNKGKLMAAEKVFSAYGIIVKQIDKDYPEIQGKNSSEIAKFTAVQAAREFNVPVIREDHSLFITALAGFPGPYTSYFDKTMPVEILLKMLNNFEDKTAKMELAAALAFPDGRVKEFSYQVPLKLSSKIKGKERNWDKILMLAEENETFAEVTEESHVDTWTKNYVAIAKEFLKGI